MEFELRPWRMEDAETIARYANNPKVAANLRDAFPHPYTQRDAAAFIQSCLDADPARCCFRAIAVNGETVGSISLSIGEDISSKSAELGYWLAEPYWGQGIMPEAVRQICGFAFQTYGLPPRLGKGRIPTGRSYAEQRLQARHALRFLFICADEPRRTRA